MWRTHEVIEWIVASLIEYEGPIICIVLLLISAIALDREVQANLAYLDDEREEEEDEFLLIGFGEFLTQAEYAAYIERVRIEERSLLSD